MQLEELKDIAAKEREAEASRTACDQRVRGGQLPGVAERRVEEGAHRSGGGARLRTRNVHRCVRLDAWDYAALGPW